MVEGARLESVYRFIAYPGFESPSLRQEHKCKKGHPRVAFLHLFHGGEKQGPCGPCDGDSKAVGLLAAAGPRDVAESSICHRASGGGWRRQRGAPTHAIRQHFFKHGPDTEQKRGGPSETKKKRKRIVRVFPRPYCFPCEVRNLADLAPSNGPEGCDRKKKEACCQKNVVYFLTWELQRHREYVQ